VPLILNEFSRAVCEVTKIIDKYRDAYDSFSDNDADMVSFSLFVIKLPQRLQIASKSFLQPSQPKHHQIAVTKLGSFNTPS